MARSSGTTIVDCFPADDLVVRLTGPAVPAWTLNGSGALELSDIKQDVLRITMHGSGTVTASGEAHETSLDVAGSSRADLSRLVTQQAATRVSAAVPKSTSRRARMPIFPSPAARW